MKQRIHFHPTKKRLEAAFVLFLFLLVSLTGLWLHGKDARAFRSFTEDFFTSEMTSNTLNMHYTVANPSSYGISSYEPVLPSYSPERRQGSQKELVRSLELLKSLDARRLGDTEGYTCRLLIPYLENEKAGMEYYYYDNPLSPSSGMQSQLPILLAEYTFRTKRDVTDYLSLLDQTDTYFGGIADYLKEQAGLGLFMPDYSVDKVIAQCDTIMDKKSLEEGSHFLETTFEERLDSLMAKNIVTEKEKALWMSENERLLRTVMLPAYEKLGDELLVLKGKGQNENGLFYYPEGKEYYLCLLKENTCSYRDIEDIKRLLLDDFTKSYEDMVTLVQNNPSVVTSIQNGGSAFAFEKPADMLKNLQQMMRDDFPSLQGVTDGVMPVCTVKSVSKNLEEYCSPAFYLTPPLDDIHENVIYINGKNNPNGVDLYTTLAHEGYPGHLYQTVYSQLFFRKNNVNPVRSLLSYGGYVEGWAMYVELAAYDYARQLMKQKAPETDALYESCRLDRKIQLCLYSLLDVAIHYEGASYAQVHKMLSSIGISTPATTRAIYEYIVEEPTTYLKYYLGYLEILELKKEAQSLWGNSYDACRFHRFYLENGPADFTSLKQRLEETAPDGAK